MHDLSVIDRKNTLAVAKEFAEAVNGGEIEKAMKIAEANPGVIPPDVVVIVTLGAALGADIKLDVSEITR